jgi:ribonuclease D
MEYQIHLLEQQQDFNQVMRGLASAAWIGFDTEFVGEKTFVPVLCLLQIVAEKHIYLVDTLRIRDLSDFLQLIENPNILKITHAGDNDYRLLNTLFGTVPQNTFDTQIAAGFVGYNYPAGFGKIVEKELRLTLAKSHTVANWEARPIDKKALDYAVEDVKYLPALHEKLTAKLRRKNRESWSREENRKWETPAFYEVDPHKELLGNDLIHQLDPRDKIKLMRLIVWRREKAISSNIPKEMALQIKYVAPIVRASRDGQNGFKANRILPEGIWRKYYQEWMDLFKPPATAAETAFLASLPKPAPEDPEYEWSMELLYHLIKKQCLDEEISAALLFPKGDFNKLKAGNNDFDESLLAGWRAELMGPTLVHLLKNRSNIRVQWTEKGCNLNYEL